MKLLVVLVAIIALCAGNAIPLIPGDNSHDVDGESRYVWMRDGNGIPQLVNLYEPINHDMINYDTRDGADNEYWLFTRQNPDNHQLLIHGDVNSVLNSNYDRNKPLAVIVHGWNNNGNSDVNHLIREAYLAFDDINVIVVDWDKAAHHLYSISVQKVPGVGQYLGNFLIWLLENAGGNWNNVHLMGHSLGAHVAGNAGRTTGGRVRRITGMDPASLQFGGSPNALKSTDAQYVETMNTDGGVWGIMDPIGFTNFYPNGGRNPQPGCWVSTCSHSRSYQLMASSITNDHFVARQCNTLQEAESVACTGLTLNMGNGNINKQGRQGLYALTTGSSYPY